MKPKCLTFERDNKPPAYTSDGYILPCCWLDEIPVEADLAKFNLKDNKLKVSNVNSIEEIITSDTWECFFNILLNNPDSAPTICKKKCSGYDN